jgi:pSer/pThr/pTyr-binding forkhead associated (FHA) protein
VSQHGETAGKKPGSFALRFISGKYQGGEFPLQDGHEVVIGRSSDLDMVLVEELVSRRHAAIVSRGGVITIEDLGSTNGTFVNGERIQRATLHEGDRVLVGTSILKVVPAAQALPGLGRRSMNDQVTQKQMIKPRVGEDAPRMSGALEEIPLPDLLQLFGTSKKTGVLVLQSAGKEGRIVLFEGKVRHASLSGPFPVPALKSVYRMLDWRQGTFELDPPETAPIADPIDLSAQEVLMEGIRQQDELNALRTKLPTVERRVKLKVPLTPSLRDLAPQDLEVLQIALNSRDLSELFDRASFTDLETATSLELLLSRGYLEQG